MCMCLCTHIYICVYVFISVVSLRYLCICKYVFLNECTMIYFYQFCVRFFALARAFFCVFVCIICRCILCASLSFACVRVRDYVFVDVLLCLPCLRVCLCAYFLNLNVCEWLFALVHGWYVFLFLFLFSCVPVAGISCIGASIFLACVITCAWLWNCGCDCMCTRTCFRLLRAWSLCAPVYVSMLEHVRG